jgi:hypothetical protein
MLSYKAVRPFKPRFIEALEAALGAYHEARVDLGDHRIMAAAGTRG